VIGFQYVSRTFADDFNARGTNLLARFEELGNMLSTDSAGRSGNESFLLRAEANR
jgi:hypothetical protein